MQDFPSIQKGIEANTQDVLSITIEGVVWL